MMREDVRIWLILIGMAVVTYIPRMLPAVLVDKLRSGPRMEKFLKLIPYTAMASLIFPGVMTVDPERPLVGLIGGGVAVVLAWRRCPVMLCVLAAIAVDLLVYCV